MVFEKGFKRIPSGLEGQVLALTHQTEDRATARPPKALKDLNFNLKHSKVRLQHTYKVLSKLLFLKVAKFFFGKMPGEFVIEISYFQ